MNPNRLWILWGVVAGTGFAILEKWGLSNRDKWNDPQAMKPLTYWTRRGLRRHSWLGAALTMGLAWGFWHFAVEPFWRERRRDAKRNL